MSKSAVVVTDCNGFFRKVALADQRVLIVDYDGTIAPFSSDRHRAFPYPAVPPLLHRIREKCRTRLIMISGRSAHSVVQLLGLNPPPEVWGIHGLERLRPDGQYQGPEVSDHALEALVQAESRLESLELSHLLDVRPGAVGVHWRGLQPSETLEVRAKAYSVLTSLAVESGLIVADFDGGVEIRLRSANTGDAVRTILSEIHENVPVAYLGDDTSDENAFRVLNGRGLTALVRPKHRFTAAQLWLRPPDELVGFLHEWIHVAGGDS